MAAPDSRGRLRARVAGVLALAWLALAPAAAGASDVADPIPSGARFVGARACAGCHAAIAADWATSPHAQAFDRLKSAGKESAADCIACHTTGAGQAGGFASDLTRLALAGVQCESCHGPGSIHTRLPDRRTIRRDVADATCATCHTPAMSHGFAAAPARFRERAAHRSEPASMPSPIAAPATAPGSPARLEVYLMPFCPAGGAAAEAMGRLATTLGPSVALEVHYIVREANPPPPALAAATAPVSPALGRTSLDPGRAACTDDGEAEMGAADAAHLAPEELTLVRGFSSLHGPSEVLEALRQLALASSYPGRTDRLLAYAAERAADPEGDWEAAAGRHGFDPTSLHGAALSAAAAKLAADAERCRAHAIAASPTILLNGVPLDLDAEHDAVARAACGSLPDVPAVCAAIPRCAHAADCRDPARPGFEGRCLDPGLPTARCTFALPPPVTLHVLNAPDCAPCNPTPIVAAARETFPALTVVAHDVTGGEGAAWVDALSIDAIPAFVFVGAESAAAYPVLAGLLAPPPATGAAPRKPSLAGARLLAPDVFPGSLFFRRPPAPGVIDLFLDATGRETLSVLQGLAALRRSSPAGSALHAAEVRLHHVLELGSVASNSAAGSPLRLVQKGAEAHLIPPGTPELVSRRGPEDLAEARRQACIALHGGPAIVEYLMDRAVAGEVDAGDWRQRVERIGLDPARIGLCAGSGAADPGLEADRRLAAELSIRPPALLVANRLRLDGLGPWNANTLMRALAGEGYGPAAGDGGTQR
jgi:Cytochrome c554 and c-prime